MTISVNQILRNNNCKKIISEEYCKVEQAKAFNTGSLGIYGLVIAMKEFDKPVSIETIQQTGLLARMIFEYIDESFIYKNRLSRYGDCISNIKIKLTDSQQKELIFTDYIDRIWLSISGHIIESELIDSDKLFNSISYENPLNTIGLTYCDITLCIKFNDNILSNPLILMSFYYDYMYLPNNIRLDLVKEKTSFDNNCTEYTVTEGMLKKSKDIIFDDFKLFPIITRKPKTYAIVLQGDNTLTINIDKPINYISIYPTEKCMIYFYRYFNYKLDHYKQYDTKKTNFIYNFNSKNLYDEFIKCHSNVLYLISE